MKRFTKEEENNLNKSEIQTIQVLNKCCDEFRNVRLSLDAELERLHAELERLHKTIKSKDDKIEELQQTINNLSNKLSRFEANKNTNNNPYSLFEILK